MWVLLFRMTSQQRLGTSIWHYSPSVRKGREILRFPSLKTPPSEAGSGTLGVRVLLISWGAQGSESLVAHPLAHCRQSGNGVQCQYAMLPGPFCVSHKLCHTALAKQGVFPAPPLGQWPTVSAPQACSELEYPFKGEAHEKESQHSQGGHRAYGFNKAHRDMWHV